jgi:2-succinyl-5-enolpyruvyl-6-hydroxy-3-cyclohexene-1-carboxylate synthase
MSLVGADPLIDRDRDAVLAFARTVGYPILADPASGLRTRGSCKEGLLSGYVFFLRTPRTRQALLQTRIWIQIGRLPTASEWQDFLPHASGMHVLVDPYGRWLDFLPRTHHLLWGSLPDLLTGLTEAIPPRRGAWWRRWTDAGCRFEQALQGCLAGHPHLDEVSTVYLLQRALPAYGFLYVASSLPIRELERYLLAQPIHRPVMAHRALNGIDGTLSIAAGISAHRGEPGLVFTGDLAFLHDLNGMLWGTRNGIALTVVVLNNRGGGIFHTLPVEADARLREVLATPHQADIPALARGYGADVHTATDRATLQTLLQDPPNRGIRVVVVPVARETYPERLHRWLARGRQLLEHLI